MALPVTAQAACPVQADLFIGIVLVQNDPFVRSTFQITNMGFIEDRRVRQGQTFQDTLTIYAHPLAVQRSDSSPDAPSILFAYQQDPEVLDHLDQLGEVHLPVTAWVGGVQMAEGEFRVRYTGTSSVDIGECRHDTWDVVSDMTLDGTTTQRTLSQYAPDLGLVLNPARIDDTGAVLSHVIYNWIGTAEDIRR